MWLAAAQEEIEDKIELDGSGWNRDNTRSSRYVQISTSRTTLKARQSRASTAGSTRQKRDIKRQQKLYNFQQPKLLSAEMYAVRTNARM